MFLSDTSQDIDAYFRYIASKKIDVYSKYTPLTFTYKLQSIIDPIIDGGLDHCSK